MTEMRPSLRTGNSAHAHKHRANDTYETPAVATRALLKVESLPHWIWEPACGPGAIARVLRAAGHDVYASDLVDYKSPDQNESRLDFLMMQESVDLVGAIVTNPPFKLANEFVAHALELCPIVVMLLRLAFLESQRRSKILDSGKLARVHVFANRLPMMHREGWTGARIDKGAVAFAWFVWDSRHKGPTELTRISWVAE